MAKTRGRRIAIISQQNIDAPVDEEEVTLDDGDNFDESLSDTDEVAVLEESQVTEEALVDDDGHAAHNNVVVKSVREWAIRDMAAVGIFITAEEEKEAGGIFPKARICILIP